MKYKPHDIYLPIIPLVVASLLIFSGSPSASPLLMGRITSVYPYGA